MTCTRKSPDELCRISWIGVHDFVWRTPSPMMEIDGSWGIPYPSPVNEFFTTFTSNVTSGEWELGPDYSTMYSPQLNQEI